MAGTFSNPAVSAWPAELMRGCIFSENFISEQRVNDNAGVASGSMAIARGATFDGDDDTIAYPLGSTELTLTNISIVIEFTPSFAADDGADHFLMDTTDGARTVIVKDSGDSLKVFLGSTTEVLKAVLDDFVELWIEDGRNVLTVIATDEDNSLYLNGSLIASSTTSWTPAAPTELYIGSSSAPSVFYAGTMKMFRIFNTLLTEEEHSAYWLDTFPSFFRSPLASYPCNEFNNRSDNNEIWDRTVNQNDLTKGDGETAGTFPTFTTDALGQEYYDFDGATDYIAALMTLPATFTITAALRDSAGALPTIQQDNDESLIDDLTAAGDYTGFLHSLVIHSGVLTALELLHDQYQHLYNLWHGRSFGAFARLGVEGSQQLSVFLDYETDPYDDHSPNQLESTLQSGLTQNGRDGTSFYEATSVVTYSNHVSMMMSDLTIFVYLVDNGDLADGVLVDKGSNYKFKIGIGADGPVELNLDLNGSSASLFGINDDTETVAVSCKSGFKPRFFRNGEFFAEGSTTLTPDDTETIGLTIGNSNDLDDVTPFDLKQVHLFDRPLADHEIIALHQQARYINNIPV